MPGPYFMQLTALFRLFGGQNVLRSCRGRALPGPFFHGCPVRSDHPVRKPQRLPSYDYRAGWFFVTICTAHRQKLFGSIRGEHLLPTHLGLQVTSCWAEVARLHEGCTVDDFALMPDHLHGILSLTCTTGRARQSLGSVLGAFKSSVTRLAKARGLLERGELWQRGFFERVIRGDGELLRCRRYIRENALAMSLPPRVTTR